MCICVFQVWYSDVVTRWGSCSQDKPSKDDFMGQEDVVLCSYLKILFQICQIKVKLSFSEWSLWWCHSIEILMPD